VCVQTNRCAVTASPEATHTRVSAFLEPSGGSDAAQAIRAAVIWRLLSHARHSAPVRLLSPTVSLRPQHDDCSVPVFRERRAANRSD
jgi:hypothetical protein